MHKEFLQTIDELGLTNEVKIQKQPLRILFSNGSEIIYRGCDDEAKLRSIHGVSMVWLEEADAIPKDIYEQLQLRLRTPGLKIRYYISFNPVSALSWLKEEFFDNPPESCSVLHTTWEHNRFLPQEYIDKLMAMKERSPLKYEVYALGKWGVTGEKVYENWRVEEFNPYDLLEDDSKIYNRIGLDFGFSHDPTAIGEYYIDVKNKKIYIHDEIYQKGLLNDHIARILKSKKWDKKIIIADSAEAKSISEFQTQHGMYKLRGAKKGKGSVVAGIDFISQFEIIVHPRCKKFIAELENYTYKKDKRSGLALNEPIDMWNHHLDGLRYVMEEFMVRHRGKTITKSMLGL